jgi:hypothetical protein
MKMSMDAGFVNAIANNARAPKVVDINGHARLFLPDDNGSWRMIEMDIPDMLPEPPVVSVETLTGLCSYLNDNRDGLPHAALTVVVEDPQNVRVYGPLEGWHRQRIHYASAVTQIQGFPHQTFLDHETFIIAAQAGFVETPELAGLFKLVGNIKSENVAVSVDDGITQQATIRRGAVMGESIGVARFWDLAPWRTFNEIEQVESRFFLRLRSGKEGGLPALALFPCDGGRWKLTAQARIAEFLKMHLSPTISVIV